jgi:hypothetical protein
MSGLRLLRLFPKVISSRSHSAIDYIQAATNLGAAALFYRRGNSRAGHAASALGLAVLINALMTDYDYGVFRRWSFKTHGVIDSGVAAASAAIPRLLDIDERDARYFSAQSFGATLISGMTNYKDDSGARRLTSRTRLGRAGRVA